MFRAEADGKALTFDLAGLIGMNFVMKDRQTGSRWQQATGECFEGALEGQRLELYPFLLTTWKEWRRRHPDTLALLPEPELADQYQRVARMAQRRRSGGRRGRRLQGVLREDKRLPTHEQVMGLEVGGGHKAYPLEVLKQQAVVEDQVGTEPVLVVYNAPTETTTAFSRRLDGRVLSFQARESSRLQFSDAGTGSVWNSYGECISGELKGWKLEPLIPLPSFWFSWAEFFPETELYTGAGD